MHMITKGDGIGRLYPEKFDPDILAAFRAHEAAINAAFDEPA